MSLYDIYAQIEDGFKNRLKEGFLKIGLMTWGSNGDVRPFLVLGRELSSRGHEVRLVVFPVDHRDYTRDAMDAGIDLEQAPPPVCDLKDLARKARGFIGRLRSMNLLMEGTFYPRHSEMRDAAQILCRSCDMVVGHFLMYPLRLLADAQGIIHSSLTFCPMIVPAKNRAPYPFSDMGGLLNRLAWNLAARIIHAALKPGISSFCALAGLPVPEDILRNAFLSRSLNLICASKVFAKGWDPEDSRHCQAGFLGMDGEDSPLHDDLEEFLSAGPPPVYMGFGSCDQLAPDEIFELMVQSAGLSGVRAIIQTSADIRDLNSLKRDIYITSGLPHRAVFPRCAGIVHHGGAGTTHTALISGKPSAVVPFMDEQVWWGQRLKEMGAAVSRPLDIRRANPRRLGKIMQKLAADKDAADRARSVGEAIRQENGPKTASDLILNMIPG